MQFRLYHLPFIKEAKRIVVEGSIRFRRTTSLLMNCVYIFLPGRTAVMQTLHPFKEQFSQHIAQFASNIAIRPPL